MKIKNIISEDLPPPENARKTQIAGTLPTYKKAAAMLDKTGVQGKALDFGAGLGLGTGELGKDAESYEPYPGEKFKPHFVDVTKIPDNAYHKIVNLNVLNVVPNAGDQRVRDAIVKNIGRVLAPGGVAIITTRGKDVLTIKGTPGEEPMSMISKIGTYQKGFSQTELKQYIQSVLGDGFEVSSVRLGPAGVMIKKHEQQNMKENNELHVGVEAYGVRGENNKKWRKTFKSQEAFEQWLDAHQDDVEVLGTREVNVNTIFKEDVPKGWEAKTQADGSTRISKIGSMSSAEYKQNMADYKAKNWTPEKIADYEQRMASGQGYTDAERAANYQQQQQHFGKYADQPQQDIEENEYADDDEYYDQGSELYSGCYVRDEQDPSGEIFQMRGDPTERRVQILDRNGSGWNISPERLTLVGEGDPDIARYFGKKDFDESDEKFGSMMNKITSSESLNTREALAMMDELIHQAGASYKEALQQASISFEIEPAKLHSLYKQHSSSIDEGKQRMSRAAKGNEKYGKDGMKALAKAGREGASEKELDAIRDKHDNYNESIELEEGETWSKHNNPRAGGMSKKSVKSYRRSHPGSKIQTAVTTKPSKLKKGSKAAKRRKSFCARMKGMKKSRTSAKTARDPNSNINKSLRRWNCESIEEMRELVMLAEQFIAKHKK